MINNTAPQETYIYHISPSQRCTIVLEAASSGLGVGKGMPPLGLRRTISFKKQIDFRALNMQKIKKINEHLRINELH